MKSVIRYGSEAIKGLEDLRRISRQIEERDGYKIVIPVALGNTTDRVAHILYSSNRIINPQEVFRLYEHLASQIGDTELRGTLDMAYMQLDFFSRERKQNKRNGHGEMELVTAERLTSHILHAYLNQAGIESAIVDPILNIDAFPVRLNGDFTQEVDMENSRGHASAWEYKSKIVIIPGNVGVYKAGTHGPDRLRTLGRGGGDTSAFVMAYGFDADETWIVTDDALTTAPTKYVPHARLVPEIDLYEAEAAGFFSTQLKTDSFVEPLNRYFSEHPDAQVYVTGVNMGSRATKITPSAEPVPIRFIASQDIDAYIVHGDWRLLVNVIYKIPADWFHFGGKRGRIGIAVSDRGKELVRQQIENAQSRGEVVVSHHPVTHIGVVGSGMKGHSGIDYRVASALRDVDVLRGYEDVLELGSGVIGKMVRYEDEGRAIRALHKELFGE